MNKKLIIQKALRLTPMAYHNSIYSHFHLWCNRYAQLFALPLGAMVQDPALVNWYKDQWLRKVELAFVVDHEDYLMADLDEPATLQDLFLQYPDKIMDIYPKPLLQALERKYKNLNTLLNK